MRRVLVCVVQHRVWAVLPFASQIHVGTGAQQHLQHLRVLRRHVRGTLAEGEHRRVDLLLDVRGGEELSHERHVTAGDGVAKRRSVPLVEVRDELRPRVEAAFSGDGQLGIGQLERAGAVRNVRADGLQAAEGGQIAVAGRANQLLGELALLFEVNRNGHGRPPSKIARVRIMG